MLLKSAIIPHNSGLPLIAILLFGFSKLKMNKLVSSPPLARCRESGVQATQVMRARGPVNSAKRFKINKIN